MWLFIKLFGSGTTTLSISNEEMNDILKIANSLEKSALLIKGVSKNIKYKAKERKRSFLGVLLAIFIASLFGNLLTGKGTIIADEGTIRAAENFHTAPSFNYF